MRCIVKESYDELSRYVAGEIADHLSGNPGAVLCLPTGNTPVGTYRELVRLHKEGSLSFAECTVFNLDEYYPIDPANPSSYRSFMRHQLFDHVDIPAGSANIPNGQADDVDEECKLYEDKIRRSGGIDLALLGIGGNGHIGFNEPDRELSLETHVVTLSESTRQANCEPFGSVDATPKQAITMGIGTIIAAKRVIVIASGQRKRSAVEKMLSSKITTDVPATLLQLHPNVTLVIDKSVGITS